MNFLKDHIGGLVAGSGLGLGTTFMFLFREMIRDTWNDYRQGKRDAARLALNRPQAQVSSLREADRLGAEVTHQLMAILTQDLADRKEAQDKDRVVITGILETVRMLASSVGALQSQALAQTTLMQVIASRGAAQ